MNRTFSNDLRRPKAHLSPYILNYLNESNPLQVVWWSAAFPGTGHFLLCKYFSGAMLMIWEFFVNVKAHINEAIFYSMIGEFEMAKAVIDTRWFLIYITVYIFTMRDSYIMVSFGLGDLSFGHLLDSFSVQSLAWLFLSFL